MRRQRQGRVTAFAVILAAMALLVATAIACAPTAPPQAPAPAPNLMVLPPAPSTPTMAMPPGPPTPTPTSGAPPPPRPTLTLEEELAVREAARREQGGASGSTTIPSGPQTAGSTITIAGREVRLPSDVYVQSLISHVTCAGPCPAAQHKPYYVLIRGKSRLGVGERSGVVFAEEIAPGEEGAFDELKQVLSAGIRP